jgi:hypothetical protein
MSRHRPHRWLVYAALALACVATPITRAQDIPTAKGPGGYVALGGGISLFQSDYGHRTLGGGLLYLDMNPEWHIGLEAEARYLRLHTDENVTESNYLAGPTYTRRLWGFRPYVKLLVGAQRMTFPYKYANGTFFTYAPGGGIQYVAGDRLIVRMVDFEYQLSPTFASFGELRPYGLSAGISLRLNPRDHFPKDASRWRWK